RGTAPTRLPPLPLLNPLPTPPRTLTRARRSKSAAMLRCNDCRSLILDHLYGLLDAPEAAAVEAHLASCPECAAARAEAARVQGLFARAAKSEFPGVRFESPTAKTRAQAPAAPARNPIAGPLPAPDARAAVPVGAPLAASAGNPEGS